MAEGVYVLCLLTSAAVSWLLLRAYHRTGTRILLWSGLGFVGLCLNNLMLIIDLIVVPDVDLSLPRNLPTLFGIALLIYGLIWEAEK